MRYALRAVAHLCRSHFFLGPFLGYIKLGKFLSFSFANTYSVSSVQRSRAPFQCFVFEQIEDGPQNKL